MINSIPFAFFGQRGIEEPDWIPASDFVRGMGYGISNNESYEMDFIATLNPITITGTPNGDYDGVWFEGDPLNNKPQYFGLSVSAFINWSGTQWVLGEGVAPFTTIATSSSDTPTPFTATWQFGTLVNEGPFTIDPTGNVAGYGWSKAVAEKAFAEGFSHLRIPINWDIFERTDSSNPWRIASEFLNGIEAVIDDCIDVGLFVVINFHNHTPLWTAANSGIGYADARAKFIAQWKQVARRYRRKSAKLLFEIVNEPRFNDPAVLQELYDDVIEEIRKTNSGRIVAVPPTFGGQVDALPFLETPTDDAVVVNAHYYEPFTFTHQGFPWANISSVPQWSGTPWSDTERERNQIKHHLTNSLDKKFGPPPDAMVVEGTGNPNADGLYLRAGDESGFPRYAVAGTIKEIYMAGTWLLMWGTGYGDEITSTDSTSPTPDLVDSWSEPNMTVRRATWLDFPELWDTQEVITEVVCKELSVGNTANIISRTTYLRYLTSLLKEWKIPYALWGKNGEGDGFQIFDKETGEPIQPLTLSGTTWEKNITPRDTIGQFIYESDFSSNLNGWTAITNGGGVANSTITNVNGRVRVSVTTSGSANWHISLLRNDIPITQGKTYHVEFKAYSESNPITSFNFAVGLNTDTGPEIQWYSNFTTVRLKQGVLHNHKTSFTMNTATDNNSRVVFRMGFLPAGTVLDIWDIKIHEQDIPENVVWTGNQNRSFNTAANWLGGTVPTFGNNTNIDFGTGGDSSPNGTREAFIGDSDRVVQGLRFTNLIHPEGFQLRLSNAWNNNLRRHLLLDSSTDRVIIENNSKNNEGIEFMGIGQLSLFKNLEIHNYGSKIKFAVPVTDEGGETGEVIDDDFTTSDNPGYFTNINSPTIDTSDNFISAVSPDANGQIFLRYLPEIINLREGDSFTLKWQARINVFTAGTNLARFTLFDSRGSKITSNVAYSDAALNDYRGYGVWVTNTRANSNNNNFATVTIAKRNGGSPVLVAAAAHQNNIDNTSDGFETMGINAWTPIQEITVIKTGNGYDIETKLGGVEGNANLPANVSSFSFTDSTPYNSFDGFALWYRTASTPTLSIKNVTFERNSDGKKEIILLGDGITEFNSEENNQSGGITVSDSAVLGGTGKLNSPITFLGSNSKIDFDARLETNQDVDLGSLSVDRVNGLSIPIQKTGFSAFTDPADIPFYNFGSDEFEVCVNFKTGSTLRLGETIIGKWSTNNRATWMVRTGILTANRLEFLVSENGIPADAVIVMSGSFLLQPNTVYELKVTKLKNSIQMKINEQTFSRTSGVPEILFNETTIPLLIGARYSSLGVIAENPEDSRFQGEIYDICIRNLTTGETRKFESDLEGTYDLLQSSENMNFTNVQNLGESNAKEYLVGKKVWFDDNVSNKLSLIVE